MGLGTTLAAWLRGLQFQGAGTWEMRAEPWRYNPSVQARWLASADSHRHSAEHGSVIFFTRHTWFKKGGQGRVRASDDQSWLQGSDWGSCPN